MTIDAPASVLNRMFNRIVGNRAKIDIWWVKNREWSGFSFDDVVRGLKQYRFRNRDEIFRKKKFVRQYCFFLNLLLIQVISRMKQQIFELKGTF